MERLTTKEEFCDAICPNPSECEFGCDFKDIKEMYNKLKEYEDLEEQGLLLKLPCKVGDTVWVIDEYKNIYDGYLFMASCGEYVIVAVEYAHCTGDFNIQLLEMVDESYDNFGVDVEIYHKGKVFLTKEEAEKALKRLECAE